MKSEIQIIHNYSISQIHPEPKQTIPTLKSNHPIEQLNTKKICRICLDDNKEEFVKPCICVGSIEYVHQRCIKEYIYTKLENKIMKKLFNFMKINCQICNRQILFQYEVQSTLQCNPCKNKQKTKSWFILLGLLILFSIIFGILGIIIIAYYASVLSSPLIQINGNGIWILLTITPMLGIALIIIIYYFIGENLYGRIKITRAKNKNQTTRSKYNCQTIFNFQRYIIQK